LRSFICNQTRIVLVEGEPCNYVIIDIYKPSIDSAETETLLKGDDVLLGRTEKGNKEIQVISILGKDAEGIFVKLCTNERIESEKEALQLLKRIYEEMGLSLGSDVGCASEHS